MAIPLIVVLAVALVTPVTAYAQAERSYKVLATSKTSTMQKELQEAADAGWEAVGQTVFSTILGGIETAGILEKSSETSSSIRYDYKLIATSRTSTLQKEIQEAADQGYQAIGMTVGGSELVVITRKIVR